MHSTEEKIFELKGTMELGINKDRAKINELRYTIK